ncbi:Gametogenetin-binding protein 2,Gametogenetin-binding protein 2-like [Acanthosepion pharaonis]|uniref:Gametogenetin-binding protein 2,Gametogenetin-binding protein 2-like n=1 Tax=Acanthosepion pharaonis TaxID=158019 RepID=A0A812D8C8_ACAPH|nr:Gametogenetin-binding protein 2,Gametogenetin-binding protein 2-like [Sepia pharaonis]
MVIQFSDKCADCDHVCGVKQRELERFVHKFNLLTPEEKRAAMMVTSKGILHLLSQTVPCVGCRRSVERLFNQLVQFQHPALEPLIITDDAVLSVKPEYLCDPKALYILFYIHGAKLNSVMESIPKSKKNKRCNLHSLDTHKTRSFASWIDIWDLLSQECREEVVLVDVDGLQDTLDAYLRKHRFCAECKSKVLKAYSILIMEVDYTSETGYCPSLYEHLRCCPQERHIHVECDTEFLSRLIGRAEPELAGSSRRDRHAKTLDIAQEEVLTCLGIHLHERMYRIWRELKAEEQTWQILFYLGINALKKGFEMELERKQGVSNLELMCEELLEEERVREQKRELKREKRKKRRAKIQLSEADFPTHSKQQMSSECKCDNSPKKNSSRIYSERYKGLSYGDPDVKLMSIENCPPADHDLYCKVSKTKGPPCCGKKVSNSRLPPHQREQSSSPPSPPSSLMLRCGAGGRSRCPASGGGGEEGDDEEDEYYDMVRCCDLVHNGDHMGTSSSSSSSSTTNSSNSVTSTYPTSNGSDCGYSSGAEGCENCGLQGSTDNTDVMCLDDYIPQQGDCDGLSNSECLGLSSCTNCRGSRGSTHKNPSSPEQCKQMNNRSECCLQKRLDLGQHKMTLSLQAMLDYINALKPFFSRPLSLSDFGFSLSIFFPLSVLCLSLFVGFLKKNSLTSPPISLLF